MTLRLSLAGTACAAGLAMFAPAQATTLTSSSATWASAVGSYASTSSTGLALYSTVTTVPLGNGLSLSVSGSADTLLQPLSGWGPWSGTYAGDIIDTTTNSETIRFSSNVSALGFDISPDLGLFGPFADTITVTLSNGQTTTVSGSFPSGTTQFVGFYGGGVTSMTISTTNAPDFAFGNIVAVPEPVSLSLFAGGLGVLGLLRRRSA